MIPSFVYIYNNRKFSLYVRLDTTVFSEKYKIYILLQRPCKMRKRRIKKARVHFISLVPKGANQLPTLYKENGKDHFNLTLLTKKGKEEGELLAVVYAPEIRDSQGDIASQEVIKEMMYESSREGVQIDIQHNGKAVSKEDAFVAESFEIQKTDSRFHGMTTYDGTPVDVTGGWGVVLKIDNEDLRQQYRDGKWQGVSLGGVAEVEETAKEDTWLVRTLEKLLSPLVKEKETEMDETKLAELMKQNNVALVKTLTESLAPVIKALAPEVLEKDDKGNSYKRGEDGVLVLVKAADKKKEETPLTKAEELRKKAKEAKKAAVLEGLDENDPEALEKAAAAIEAIENEKPKSNQTATRKTDNTDPDFDEDVVKSMVKCLA
jgi:hypothetical protein